MFRITSLIGLLIVGMLAIPGCQKDNNMMAHETPTKTNLTPTAETSRATARTYIWADDHMYRSVVTPAVFNNPRGPFDELYNGDFKGKVGHISDSKPGDQDYNGGRWHVNNLKNGVPSDKYQDASRVEDLDLDDFESAGIYFECPLLP
jgi:hypothetical protein